MCASGARPQSSKSTRPSGQTARSRKCANAWADPDYGIRCPHSGPRLPPPVNARMPTSTRPRNIRNTWCRMTPWSSARKSRYPVEARPACSRCTFVRRKTPARCSTKWTKPAMPTCGAFWWPCPSAGSDRPPHAPSPARSVRWMPSNMPAWTNCPKSTVLVRKLRNP